MLVKKSSSFLLGTLQDDLGLDADRCLTIARLKRDRDLDPTLYTIFVEEYLSGYDACIKALVKNSKQASGIALQPGITELLADIRNDASLLETTNTKLEALDSDKAMDATDDQDQQELQEHFQITIRTKDPKNNVQVDTSGLGDEFREKVQHCRELIKQRVDAIVALVSLRTLPTWAQLWVPPPQVATPGPRMLL